MEEEHRTELIARILEELNRVAPQQLLPMLLQHLGPAARATGLRLFIADVEERVLNLWGEAGSERHPPVRFVRVEGSEHGAVYRSGRPERVELVGGPVMLAPVSTRGERIGLVELSLEPDAGNEAAEAATAAGLLLGHFVSAGDQWTDEFHIARRRQDMSLAAEVQWNTLPLAAFIAGDVALAGALEPAYDIGGDVFDYSYGRDVLWVGIFDAMGHGLTAARVSSLTVAAFRNARRRGEDLEAQARFIDGAVRDLVDWRGFVTGQLVRLDLSDPTRTRIVNAGHPPPFLHRGDGSPERVHVVAHYPFGIPFPNPLVEEPLPLERGDRLVLFSDGIAEARPDGGEPFGEPRVRASLQEMRPLSARETARRLIARVREHRAADLSDDATVMVIDLT